MEGFLLLYLCYVFSCSKWIADIQMEEDKMRSKVGGAECGGEENEYKLLATKSRGNRLLTKT